jgi:ipoprotein LpqH
VKKTVRFAGAVLVAAITAGCSSLQQEPAQPGALVPGTAEVTINDQKLSTFQSVDCTPAGDTVTIATGNANSGATVVVANGDKQVVRAVTINDLGGFTGSYTQDLAGAASVSMTGATYAVTGTADGFQTDNPSFRANGTFTIKAAC